MSYVIKGMGVHTIQYGYRFFSESILSGCKPMLSSTSIVFSSRLIVWALFDWVDFLITTTSSCRGAAWLLSSDVLTIFCLQDVKILRCFFQSFKPVKSYCFSLFVCYRFWLSATRRSFPKNDAHCLLSPKYDWILGKQPGCEKYIV